MTESIRSKKWNRKKRPSYTTDVGAVPASGTGKSYTSSRRSRRGNSIQLGDDRPASTPRASLTKRTYTAKTLMDLALFYCAKRETSRPKLEQYLKRKMDLNTQPEGLVWIEEVLQEFERLNVINHERFAGMLNRDYARRGKGKRYIEQKLKEKGVGEQTKGIEFSPDEELERAIQVALKSVDKSTFKKITDAYARKQKLTQKLMTHGFDYSIAKKAVEVALKKD